MAATKCTLLFNYVSNTGAQSGVGTIDNAVTRTAGWSESWYLQNLSPGDVVTRTLNLARARAALLPIGCSVIGQRYQDVDPIGPSRTGSTIFPGTAGTLADVPQMALFFRIPADNGRNIRPVMLRGLPDARCVRGEYMPVQSYDDAIVDYFAIVRGSFFRFRGRNLALPEIPVVAVIGNTVSTQDLHNFTEGMMVRILRTVDDDTGQKLGGLFQVRTPILTRSFGIYPDLSWDARGGRVRQDAVDYFGIGSQSSPRVAIRKVGRPFFGYRGRQSAKR